MSEPRAADNDAPSRVYAVNDSIGWDDRKTLSDLWQDHAPLPEIGLSDAAYEALLAVARWGAERMYDNYVIPPTPDPSVEARDDH